MPVTEVPLQTSGKDESEVMIDPNLARDPYGLIGTVFAKTWVAEELIGIGGMAAVYRARDLETAGTVALKVLKPDLVLTDPEMVAAFRREAQATVSLLHPNIIRVIGAKTTDDQFAFLVLEWLDGLTLRTLLEQQQTLAPERFLPLFDQMCEAVDYAHSKGIIHRDLKPGNLMVVKDHRGAEMIKILDFGIARALSSSTILSRIIGTPLYASPEQLTPGLPIDHHSDIYSLGVILFETLSGRVPFSDPMTVRLLEQHRSAPPPSLREIRPDLPAAVDQVIQRALSKAPAERFDTAVSLAQAFRQALNQEMASIHLRCLDQATGARIAGAAVWLNAQPVAQTDATGCWRSAPLPPQQYSIEIKSPFFRTWRKILPLTSGQHLRGTVQLVSEEPPPPSTPHPPPSAEQSTQSGQLLPVVPRPERPTPVQSPQRNAPPLIAILLLSLLLLVIPVVFGVWYFAPGFADSTRTTDRPALAQRLESALEKGSLLQPPGDNAWDLYQQISGLKDGPVQAERFRLRLAEAFNKRAEPLLDLARAPGHQQIQVVQWKEARDLYNRLAELTHQDPKLSPDSLKPYKYQVGLIPESLGAPLAREVYCEGRLAAAQGDAQQAERLYRAAAGLSPQWAIPHLTIAEVLRAQQKQSEAKEHLLKAVALDQNLPTAHYYLGEILFSESPSDQAGEDQARAEFAQAQRLLPDWSRPQLRLGDFAFKQKKYADAADWYEKALRAGTDSLSNGEQSLIKKKLEEVRKLLLRTPSPTPPVTPTPKRTPTPGPTPSPSPPTPTPTPRIIDIDPNRDANALMNPEKNKVYPEFSRIKWGPLIWVDIEIDEAGRVIAAKARVGPPAKLCREAEDAARQWRYAPFIKQGRPVRVRGSIYFNNSFQ